jgi:hypothetical protein
MPSSSIRSSRASTPRHDGEAGQGPDNRPRPTAPSARPPCRARAPAAARRPAGAAAAPLRGRQASIPARQIAGQMLARHRARLVASRRASTSAGEAELGSASPLVGRSDRAARAIPLLYFLAASDPRAVPANRGWREAKEGVTIFVRTNGVHTWIMVPKVTPEMDWRPLVRTRRASQGSALGRRRSTSRWATATAPSI